IWYAHHVVLRELGDPQAGAALARAHASYTARLALIEEPVWRESFAALELHRRIVRDFSCSNRPRPLRRRRRRRRPGRGPGRWPAERRTRRSPRPPAG